MNRQPTPNITQLEQASAGGRIKLMLVGAVVVLLIIAAYFLLGTPPPIATGEVNEVFLYPVHHEGTRPATAGTVVTTTPDVEDDVLVLAEVKLMNIGKTPLTLVDVEATLTAADGEQRSETVNETDYARVFAAYPDLVGHKRYPLLPGIQIPPDAIVDGEVIFHYQGTRDMWEKRKGFRVTATFNRNPPLVLTPR